MPENVGFVSTRFAGTDGVSLESAKWAEVLWEDEHFSAWYGGRLDRAPDVSMCIPEAYFHHPENDWINEHQMRIDHIKVHRLVGGTVDGGWPGFQLIKAVRENQVYIIDEMIVSRPTTRLLKGIQEIGSKLYPIVFSKKSNIDRVTSP